MKRSRKLAAVLVGVVVVQGGCASSEPSSVDAKEVGAASPIVFRSDTSRAPRDVSEVAIVEDGRVTLPETDETAAWAKTLAEGMVIAGDRASDASREDSKNPLGFLRRVVSIERRSSKIILMTEPAVLTDLIQKGEVRFGKGRSIFEDRGPRVITEKSVQPLSNGAEGGNDVQVAQRLALSAEASVGLSVSMALNPQMEGQAQIDGVVPTLRSASVEFSLNPEASVDLELSATANVVRNGDTNLGGTWPGPRGLFTVPSSIPVTIRYRTDLICSASVGGKINAKASASLKSRVAAKYAHNGREFETPQYETPVLTPSFNPGEVTASVTLTAKCAIKVSIGIYAFDAVGFEGAVAPYAQLTVEPCLAGSVNHGANGGVKAWGKVGLESELKGRLQVPAIASTIMERSLFDIPPLASEPHYFLGDPNTCSMPTGATEPTWGCSDKADGWYCSETTENSAYECKGGSTVYANQCPTGQRCVGPLTDGIRCE